MAEEQHENRCIRKCSIIALQERPDFPPIRGTSQRDKQQGTDRQQHIDNTTYYYSTYIRYDILLLNY